MKASAKIMLGSFLVVGAMGGAAMAAEYQIDTAHSDITFKVRHMGISTVTGKFEKFGGTFDVNPADIKATKGSAVIEVASINTGNAKRDGHVKSEDFFAADKFPTIKFTSKEVKDVNLADSTATLVGDLTIRGVTKPVSLKIKGDGILPNDGWGNERAAFHASGTINRFDYGLKWNKAIEAGSLVVGENVELVLAFEGVRKLGAPAVAAPAAEKAGKEKKAKKAPAAAPADTSSGVKGGVQSHTKSGY